MMKDVVSVIVPVYNVEEYVDKCISSISAQTYKNLEILLVINCSNDRSHIICEEWSHKDSRIKCLYPEGRGLGNARNVGIENATGEYICFIDSDDWIDSHYVEYMLDELKSKNCDIVDCHFCKAFADGSTQYGVNCSLSQFIPDRIYEAYDPPCAWRSISKLSLWKDNGIRYTNTIAEDLSVYSLLRAVSGKISHIDSVLYFYRVRGDSLSIGVTVDPKKYDQLFEVLEWIVEEHKKRGLFDRDKAILLRQTETHLRNNIANFAKYNHEIDIDVLKKKANDFLINTYGKEDNIISRRSVSFGSYSIGRINNFISTEGKPWEHKYCYSSIISVTSDKMNADFNLGNNEFRKIQIKRDLSKSFWNDISLNEPQIILWDCLEEIGGVIQNDNGIITNSEIIDGLYVRGNKDRLIEFGSDEWWEAWKKAVRLFVERILSNNTTKIMLIKTYLSECKGKRGAESEFDDIEKIRSLNDVLDEMYSYINKEYSSIRSFELPENGLLYTDENFEYGCTPKHFNGALYAYMGMIITDSIMRK